MEGKVGRKIEIKKDTEREWNKLQKKKKTLK
jgi:hypothetical protein